MEYWSVGVLEYWTGNLLLRYSTTPLLGVDSNFSNVEQNYVKKIYRAKTPSTQRKTHTYIPNLGALCAFARDIVFVLFFNYPNCRKNLRSFWKKSRISSMPYFNMAIRSTPIPKANPENFSGS